MLADGAGEQPGLSTLVAVTSGADAYFALKRALDVTLAITMFVLLSPVMVAIALLIKLDSPGPVIFAHARIGARWRPAPGGAGWETRSFRLYKFRSMIQNADQSLHQAQVAAFVHGTPAGPGAATAKFKVADDPRVTRLGRWLRRTSLDELPQLVNVLKGDMSLVGPRPVPPYEVAHYQAWHYERLAALPGVTGLWQVKGRCQLPFDDMIRLDLEYVRRRSLWLDVKILILTIPAVLRGDGAA